MAALRGGAVSYERGTPALLPRRFISCNLSKPTGPAKRQPPPHSEPASYRAIRSPSQPRARTHQGSTPVKLSRVGLCHKTNWMAEQERTWLVHCSASCLAMVAPALDEELMAVPGRDADD